LHLEICGYGKLLPHSAHKSLYDRLGETDIVDA
jgi:hypothetical protein